MLPAALKAVTLILNVLPIELAGILVITNEFKLGKFLTEMSLSTFASTQFPPSPSSMKTAYPMIEQPPLEVGSVHYIEIDQEGVVSEDTLAGFAIPVGIEHGV